MSTQTEDVLAKFDDARYRIWKLFVAIMKSVNPSFEEPEPE